MDLHSINCQCKKFFLHCQSIIKRGRGRPKKTIRETIRKWFRGQWVGLKFGLW